MSQDLREFLRTFEHLFPQQVLRVERELSPVFEPTALIMELDRLKQYPLVFFEHIAGSAFSVAANVLATRQRLGLATILFT